MKILTETIALYRGSFSRKIIEGKVELLNLPSILEVATYLMSTNAIEMKKFYKNIEVQVKKWFSHREKSLFSLSSTTFGENLPTRWH